ncbi:MAG: O-methyltransferase [Anaerolineales bacterium]
MTTYDDQLSSYISSLFAVEDEYLLNARDDSPKYGLPGGNIQAEEGRFLQFLAYAIGASKAVEIGTLGGYSGIWIARGLRPGGKLITIDKEAKHAEVAQKHFEAAGLQEVVDIRVGNALQIISRLPDEGPFDFVFIDADRPAYPTFYNWAVENIRNGGIIAIHNAFRKGTVAGIGDDDEHTELMRQLNRRIAEDPRVSSTIFPAGDGTLISVRQV